MNLNESNNLLKMSGYRFVSVTNPEAYDDPDDAPSGIISPDGRAVTREQAESEIALGRVREYRVLRGAEKIAREIEENEEFTRIEIAKIGWRGIKTDDLVNRLPRRPAGERRYNTIFQNDDGVSVIVDVEWTEIYSTKMGSFYASPPIVIKRTIVNGLEIMSISNGFHDNPYYIRAEVS